MFQGIFKEVSRKFQGSTNKVSRKFHGTFKEFSRNFLGYFKDISRNLLKISLDVSSKIYECYNLRVFQGSFKGIVKKLRKFQGVSRVFQGSLNSV